MIYTLFAAENWTDEKFRAVVEAEAAIYFDRPGRGFAEPLEELEVVSRSRPEWATIWQSVVEAAKAERRRRLKKRIF